MPSLRNTSQTQKSASAAAILTMAPGRMCPAPSVLACLLSLPEQGRSFDATYRIADVPPRSDTQPVAPTLEGLIVDTHRLWGDRLWTPTQILLASPKKTAAANAALT